MDDDYDDYVPEPQNSQIKENEGTENDFPW